MQNISARSLSPDSSLKQNTNKNITKNASECVKVPVEHLEKLAERLKLVFLDAEVGGVFQMLYRAAHANQPKTTEQHEIYFRLALSEAYARAMKHGRR